VPTPSLVLPHPAPGGEPPSDQMPSAAGAFEAASDSEARFKGVSPLESAARLAAAATVDSPEADSFVPSPTPLWSISLQPLPPTGSAFAAADRISRRLRRQQHQPPPP